MLHPHKPSPGAADEPAGLPRYSEQKRQQILIAAADLFLNQGFEATTMDAIARKADVSKATVYAHAKNKQELFAAIVNGKVASIYGSLDMAEAGVASPEDALLKFAGFFSQLILSSGAKSIYRLVIAEAPRNPELGRIFFENGPRVVQSRLAAILKAQHDAGRLVIDDPLAAAQDFVGMLHGRFHLPCVLGLAEQPTEAEMTSAVERTVRTFLRAYAPR